MLGLQRRDVERSGLGRRPLEGGTSLIRAVLFDLDGVLIDATEWHYEALNRALAPFGFSITRFEHLSSYNGLPTRRKLEMLTLEKGLPAALHGVISKLKQLYTREEVLAKCWPSFEKEYMVSRLEREGFRLGVCSNATRESVDLMLRRSALFDSFDVVLGNEDVPRPKPDPAIYLEAMQRLGLKADETLIVEDAGPGIEAARAAGAHVVVVGGFGEVDYWRVKAALESLQPAC